MSCRCRKIDCASVRGLTAHGYSLIARKPTVGVGATWRFAGTPPSLGASTHARVSGSVQDRLRVRTIAATAHKVVDGGSCGDCLGDVLFGEAANAKDVRHGKIHLNIRRGKPLP